MVRRSTQFLVASLVCAMPLLAQNSFDFPVIGTKRHVLDAVAASKYLGVMPRSTRMSFSIGLPLRNQGELDTFLNQIVDPDHPNFRQYLTSAQFAERFGPSEEDYQALAGFIRAKGLEVTGTHPNRMILDVGGKVTDIEGALRVNMVQWLHPTRGTFFAPDREPSLDSGVAILGIAGLDNFVVPSPMDIRLLPLPGAMPLTTGSSPGSGFIGNDFRAAYAPGVTLNGAGQSVGLFELDGFYASDVAANFKQARLPPVPTQTVLLNGSTGAPGGGSIEVTLDIMMAAYMAPGLSSIIVYQGSNVNDVLNRMATDNLAKQLSSSWLYATDATTEQIFKQMIAQGQSFFQASGDSGGYPGWVMSPADDPYITVVGGTSLITAGPGGPWQSETTWRGSGGGISAQWPIPSYQKSVNMAAIGGSTTMRNVPDVALTADTQIYLIQSNGQAVVVGGTSAATPLWAGFMALTNQQAAANGNPPVGFLNPLIYRIGSGPSLQTDMHDITTGTNGFFAAVAGYDLATGWGSPAGQGLINDLSGTSNPPGYRLTISASTLSVAGGKSAVATIGIDPQNGFNGSVNLAVSGLPEGVTAVFSPGTAATSSTMTLTASNSVATGTWTVTITGTSGSLVTTVRLTLAVTGLPRFSISVQPTNVSRAQDGTGTGTSVVTLTGIDGFNGTVTLAALDLPDGVTASFSPVSPTGTSTMTLTASSSAATGTSTAIVTGIAGTTTGKATITVTVGPPSSFTLSTSLASISLRPLRSSSSTIIISGQDGFNALVGLSVGGLPAGVTAVLGSNATMSSSTLTLNATSTAAYGNATIVITGSAGSLTRTTTIALTITPTRVPVVRPRPRV